MRKTLIVVSLLFLATACTEASSSTKTSSSSGSTPAANSTAAAANLDQSYSNTADGYSYSYPNGYTVEGTNDYGSSATITPTAAASNVEQNNSTNIVFSVTEEPDIQDLSADTIQQYLAGAYVNATDYTVTPAKVAGVSGFEVTDDISADSVASDFYYVQNGNGTTLELVVQKNNPVATAIFNSVTFNQ